MFTVKLGVMLLEVSFKELANTSTLSHLQMTYKFGGVVIPNPEGKLDGGHIQLAPLLITSLCALAQSSPCSQITQQTV